MWETKIVFPTKDLIILENECESMIYTIEKYVTQLKASSDFQFKSETIDNCILAIRHLEDAMTRMNRAEYKIMQSSQDLVPEIDSAMIHNI